MRAPDLPAFAVASVADLATRIEKCRTQDDGLAAFYEWQAESPAFRMLSGDGRQVLLELVGRKLRAKRDS